MFMQQVSVETKRLLAVHEAGHILLAHLFTRFDWHAFSQLLPGGKVHILNGAGDYFNYAFILEVFAIELAFNKPDLFKARDCFFCILSKVGHGTSRVFYIWLYENANGCCPWRTPC